MSTTESVKSRPHLGPPAPPGRPEGDDRGAAADVETVIRPQAGWIAVDWAEMVRCRELLYYFVWRDVKIRYKQTVLGVAWAVLQPLLTTVIFTFIFGRIGNLQAMTPGVPYPVFVFAGLIMWTYFAGAVNGAAMSLISQQHLLTKIYFPRLFVPMSSIGTVLVDLAISLVIYAAMMLFYGVVPSRQALLLVPLIAVITMAAMGIGCASAALTVLYRDFRYLIGFALQIGMYVSPVIFPIGFLPAQYRPILALNPMFGLIGGCRSAVLGTPWDLPMLAISTASSLALFAFGLFYFRKTERRFADIV